MSPDSARRASGASSPAVRYREALERIAECQPEALRIIETNGFMFEDIGREPGNWQHLAFTLYTELCEVDTIVRHALIEDDAGAAAVPEPQEPRETPLGRLSLDEIDQMTDASSDSFSAGEWCEAACDALAWARYFESLAWPSSVSQETGVVASPGSGNVRAGSVGASPQTAEIRARAEAYLNDSLQAQGVITPHERRLARDVSALCDLLADVTAQRDSAEMWRDDYADRAHRAEASLAAAKETER